VKQSLGKITQVAFMTRDIGASIEHFVAHLGVGPWFVLSGGTFSACRYRGVACAPRLTTAFASARGMEFELMQLDNDEPCMWRDALQKPFAREAFHHWCHWPDDYDATLAASLAEGYRVYQDGATPRGRFVYLEHPANPDDILELTERLAARRAFQEQVAEAGRSWDGITRIATAKP
jgi:catechol 2,3-dioxygenase-like lactoylglutathione lyase family enzyme